MRILFVSASILQSAPGHVSNSFLTFIFYAVKNPSTILASLVFDFLFAWVYVSETKCIVESPYQPFWLIGFITISLIS